MTFCFDSSACLRFLDDEEGAEQVDRIVRLCASGDARLLISAIQWGEIASVILRRGSFGSVSEVFSKLIRFGFEPVSASAEQAVKAATIQHKLRIPYADAFLVALAQNQHQAIIVTADFDFKSAEHLISVEFLPRKPVAP